MEFTGLTKIIASYIDEKKKIKLTKLDKETQRIQKKINNSDIIKEMLIQQDKKRESINKKYDYLNWINDAAKRVKQLKFVTHANKYTHPDVKGMSVFSTNKKIIPRKYTQHSFITTASLVQPEYDIVGNAAALDVGKFLLLKYNDKSLIDYIRNDDISPLLQFTNNENKVINNWLISFKQVLIEARASSHTLSKQVYIPISSDNYHLVSPLFASSLVQKFYECLDKSLYSEKAKEARKAKRESVYSDNVVEDYTSLAIQYHGGSKPQNISFLNSKRSGEVYLFSSAPPQWAKKEKPPLGVKTIFSYGLYGNKVFRKIYILRNYLKQKFNRSSTLAIRTYRAECIDDLIDNLIQYAAEIQSIHDAGWSALPECKLSHFERLWLDPRRAQIDKDFAYERGVKDWQKNVADAFATWLNNKLKIGQLIFSDVEHREWKSLVTKRLNMIKDIF